MSMPTDKYEDQTWWRVELDGAKQPVHDSDPQAGFYKYRKFKGGPWIPVMVWRHGDVDTETGELMGDETLYAVEDGTRHVDPRDKWTWYCQSPISPEDYQLLVDGEQPATEPESTIQTETKAQSLADADPVF